ncbi:MAG: SseB family protein [Candidatus Nanopelagicales bacterium]
MTGHGEERPDPEGRFVGKVVPDPGFAGDTGVADPVLAAALAARATTGPAADYDVVAALAPTRLLVPVVAVLDEAEVSATGHRTDKSSHMASVSLTAPDGRRGLLAFTSTQALVAWNPQARPVPVGARQAALAAVEEGASALLLDVAGPVPFPVEGPALRALATGRDWVPPYHDPDVRGAIVAALASLTADGWVDVRVDPPREGADLVVVLMLPGGAHPDGRGPEALARAAADLLSGVAVLRERLVAGLALAVEA